MVGMGIALHSRTASNEHTLNTAWNLAADGEYAKAERVLLRWLNAAQGADDEARAKAMFWLGYCQERQGRRQAARQTYETVIDRYGGSKPAAQARRRLARPRSADSGQ